MFKPYELELGRLTLAWNSLHEQLGQMFRAVFDTPNGAIPFAIWHKLASDRMQREILQAAVEAGAFSNLPHASADALWLLKRCKSLSEDRNNALHAPLQSLTGLGGSRIEPATFFGNVRAKNLAARPDLLSEFIWYRETAEALADFAFSMQTCLNFPALGWPWPDRPKLPSLGRQKSR
jgi:hypothetical protein